MPRSTCVPLLALALASLAPAAAAQPPVPSPPASPPAARAPLPYGPALVFAGRWRSDADPANELVIRALGPTIVSIHARPRFDAQGLANDTTGCVALVRTPAWVPEARSDYHFGVLHLQRADAHTLRALFADELQGTTTRVETWSWLGPQATLPSPRDSTGGPGLPRFGDTVAAEVLPEAVTTVQPAYPEAARQQQIEGTVVVQALVGRDGLVKEAFVARSVPGLDDAALAAVRQWRFRPALAKGQPVAVWVAVPVRFSLH